MAAPVAPLRRSARLAAKPTIVYCEDDTTFKRNPDHWNTSPAYSGLIPYLCAKLDADNKAVRERLAKFDEAADAVAKTHLTIDLFRYLYINNLLLLRSPSFRKAVMEKLNEIRTSPSITALITPTQHGIIVEQHKLFTEYYKEMTTHPLYVA